MSIVRPVIAGYTLPHPVTFVREAVTEGGTDRAVTGAVAHTVVNSVSRYTYELSWELVEDSDVTTMIAMWEAIRTGSFTFTDVFNASHTCKRHPDQQAFRMEHQPARGGTAYVTKVSLKLIQVLGGE